MIRKYWGKSYTKNGYEFKREKDGGIFINILAVWVDKLWELFLPYMAMVEFDLDEEDDVQSN